MGPGWPVLSASDTYAKFVTLNTEVDTLPLCLGSQCIVGVVNVWKQASSLQYAQGVTWNSWTAISYLSNTYKLILIVTDTFFELK